jgi:ubiquinone/menaquinone biosynthesis C-methylase UbiE
MAKKSYDRVAAYYDFLSKLIYGNAIDNANAFLVSHIKPNSSILIIGGGTGHILTQIAEKFPAGLEIMYVDHSPEMIRLSKKKFVAENKVIFVADGIQNVTLSKSFDVIITPFLFDNFSQNTAVNVFMDIASFLKPGGLWLFADFKAENLWQKIVLKIMYTFFRLTCNIEAKQLPDVASLFSEAGYKIIAQRNFYHNFIYSIVYKN